MRIFRLLDLYCGAGGASRGFHDAGFEVVGVDIAPQKNYPYEFHQADALDFAREHGHEFDAIAASPPCQAYSLATTQWRKAGKEYPDMVAETRRVLQELGKPYVIENVPGAPLINPTKLNGAFFNMRVRRTRLFETSYPMPLVLLPPEPPSHFPKMGRPVEEGEIITPVGHFSNVGYARRVMGIDWMTGKELTQAIPPAYTHFIGTHLMAYLHSRAAAE